MSEKKSLKIELTDEVKTWATTGCKVCTDNDQSTHLCHECKVMIKNGEMGWCDDCGGFWHKADKIHCECWWPVLLLASCILWILKEEIR